MKLTEGQKATLWVAGCIGELRRLDLVDGPKLTTPKGIALFDQLDAARDRLDPDVLENRIESMIHILFGKKFSDFSKLRELIMHFYEDRNSFNQKYGA